MIRPRPARWFELLVARDDTTLALEALATTGAVELETREGAALPASFADLSPLIQRFDAMAQRYQAWWPVDSLVASSVPEPPAQALQRCVDRLQAWAASAEPLIRRLQEGQAEAEELVRWQQVFVHLEQGARERQFDPGRGLGLDLGLAASAAAPLGVRLSVVPAPGLAIEPAAAPASGAAGAHDGPIVLAFEAQGWQHVLAVGSAAQLQTLSQLVAAAKGRWLVPPPWLQREPAANHAHAAARLDALHDEAQQLGGRIAALAEAHDLRRALADARRLHWVIDNVHGLEAGEWLCWITGWTSAGRAALEAAIDAGGARALLRLPPAPRGARAPMLLANPAWARPFEVFARALGMPSGNEADPSALLAIAVPLMFGYMFGDVGQGLVIAAVGFALRRRYAIARLFIAGGLAAVVFGFVFGSVFSLHHVLPALWIDPLDDPLVVLLAPLVGGALLLTVGLALSALEAFWRGELGRWLATDAGYLVCYLALVTAPFLPARFAPAALALAGAGALAFCVGHAAFERRALAALGALGELVERLLQILINTLSFARVGAFALAHAGLSSAVFALMDAAAHPVAAGLVLVLGNAVIIVLEGLVVAIQTTRLVLFEFFTRFLSGQGRVFRPLPPPPSTLRRPG